MSKVTGNALELYQLLSLLHLLVAFMRAKMCLDEHDFLLSFVW